ncbi:MAG: hypothetical protein U1F65_00575 [Verrucomicrobiota bacterium]
MVKARRWQFFVFVDLLATLPLLAAVAYEAFWLPGLSTPRWGYAVMLGLLFGVMLPSMFCVLRWRMRQIIAGTLILLYLLLIAFLFLRLLKDGTWIMVLGHFVGILLVAKSIYGACMVCKTEADF